jgi:hypothetical protein
MVGPATLRASGCLILGAMKRFGRAITLGLTGVLAVIVIYMLGFGLAYGFAWRNRAPSMGDPLWVGAASKPVDITLHALPKPVGRVYYQYVKWCISAFH